ncbi:SLOG domain-containing protein [Mucilaginibacter phyllosphaerae]
MSYFPFTVVLSASVPSEKRSEKYQQDFIKIKNAQVQIEEAIIGLSRNIFQKNGRIIFGGHPSISPLVAMVAGEFHTRKKGSEDLSGNEIQQKPIMIFQSKAFEKVIPEDTTKLLNQGDSAIVWTDAANGEAYDETLKGKEQCLESLARMRRQMMEEEVDALVCMGGMEGVEQEFEIFRKMHPDKPIYILETTGGASSILAKRVAENDMVTVIDRNVNRKLEKLDERFELIPYAYITALIIHDLMNGKYRY